MKARIFKVQTALNKTKHLVYDERREYLGEFPFDDTLFGLVGYKGYVLATVNKQGQICVQRKLKEKEWPLW